MNKFRNNSVFNSIFFKLFAIFTLLIPINGMFIYINYQTRTTLIHQVQTAHEHMLQSYWNQIDNQLNNAVTFAINTAWFQSDPQIALSNTDSEAALAKQRISLKLSEQILYGVNFIDTFFVYTDQEYLSANQTSTTVEERNAIRSYVQQSANSSDNAIPSLASTWKITTLNNQSSLVFISKGNNGVITGIYINLDKLLKRYSIIEEIENLTFVQSKDIPMLSSSYSNNSIVVTSSSSVVPVSFVEIIDESIILKSLPFMQKNLWLISIAVILLIPFVFFLLRLTVIHPLQELNKAMKHIKRGDLNYRIQPHHASNEILIVNQTFNKMMDEVQNLKISVYEEEIKTQKSLLRNLQLQIQPHFIINSLNMVFNLLENKDYQVAKKLVVHSVDFYRYMVKADADLVPLNEELHHVNTYLQIQLIRYQDKFTYSIESNEMVDDMLVPPMLVQNFIENSIKYSIQSRKSIHISVRVESFEIDFYPFAKIIISDTGSGYPEHQLVHLNEGRNIEDHAGKHIGISNTVQRLSLLYDRQAKWHFYNHNGAVSEITLPALFPELTVDSQLDEE